MGEVRGKRELLRAVKFALFSASAGLIQLGAFALLNELLLPGVEWLSYLIALVLSVLWNFTLNRKFTFQSAGNVPVAMLKVAAYYAVFTPASTWLEHALTGAGWNGYLVTALNMLLNFSTEFLYDRFYVFRVGIDTNERASRS